MPDLPQVTLCAADTQHPALAILALRRCMAQVRFARVLLLTDPRRLSASADTTGIDVAEVRLGSRDDYSRFMLTGLLPHVHTSHVLIAQWDGWALSGDAWRDEFLGYDYLGAPWPADRVEARRPPELTGPLSTVGNGGFSLRSRRLLQALTAPGMALDPPEDTAICWRNRPRLEAEFGLRFAPPDLAAEFATERPWTPGSFGFHGVFNLHRALPRDELLALLQALPDDLRRHNDTRKLILALLDRGWWDEAALLIDARTRHAPREWRTLRLRARLAVGRARLAVGWPAPVRPDRDR